MPREKTKDELLEEARNEWKVPQMFVQYDGFVGHRDSGDYVMQPDDDGDVLVGGSGVCDLRASGPDLAVRVQIHYDAKVSDVLRAIDKLRDLVVSDLGGVGPNMTAGEVENLRELKSLAARDQFRKHREDKWGLN